MPQKAYIVNDIVQSKENDINQNIVVVPVALESKPISELLYKESSDALVDATLESNFFIDDNLVKHLQNYSPDKVSISRSITLNRRGGPDDVIEATTGSFVTDGFVVGKIINLNGSINSDGVPMKLKTVSALEMTIDEDFSRIVVDESTPATITIEQGWQRLEGINFSDEIGINDQGLFYVKGAAELRRDAVAVFTAQTVDIVRQHRIEQTPYPERHCNPPEADFATAKIVRAATSFSYSDCLGDAANFGSEIYAQVADQLTGVDITFDAVNDRITRASGDFTTGNWQRIMNVRPTGSTNNDKVFAIKSVEALHLNVSVADADKLVDEGPVSGVTLDGLCEISAYAKFRNSDNPAEVAQENWIRFMQEGVAWNWFDQVADNERNWIRGADNSNAWAASTVYAVDDIVFDPGTKTFKICNTAHTSGTGTIQDDISNWDDYTPDGISLPDYPTTQIAS